MFRLTNYGKQYLEYLKLVIDKVPNSPIARIATRQYNCLQDVWEEGISGDLDQLMEFLKGSYPPKVELVEDV